jgi:hypothetical protein
MTHSERVENPSQEGIVWKLVLKVHNFPTRISSVTSGRYAPHNVDLNANSGA